MSEEQIAEIEESCADNRKKLDAASFTSKRLLIEMLDVHGKLALDEKEEKVVYVKCLIAQQRLSVALTLPLLNIGETVTTVSVYLPMDQFR